MQIILLLHTVDLFPSHVVRGPLQTKGMLFYMLLGFDILWMKWNHLSFSCCVAFVLRN